MAAPSNTVNKVRYRLIDTSSTNPNLLTATTLEEAVVSAVTKYSQDRPLEVTEDETGLSTPYIPVVGSGAVLASWVDGFSRILTIEYPAEAVGADYTPSYLNRDDDWDEGYRDASKKYIRLKTITPAASDILRITYTARHTHTTATDTIPAGDLDAVCDLAAHFACLAMATKMAASNDPLMKADSVNYRDGQLRFKQQADAWLAAYNDKMGLSADGAGATGPLGASATADWDRGYQTGLPFLTHWGRRR